MAELPSISKSQIMIRADIISILLHTRVIWEVLIEIRFLGEFAEKLGGNVQLSTIQLPGQTTKHSQGGN